MKLTLPTFKKKNGAQPAPRKFRVDARRYWVFLLSGSVLLLAGELIFFSVWFLRTSARIEAPATPTLETNDSKIAHMKSKLDAVEAAVKARTGKSSSQSE